MCESNGESWGLPGPASPLSRHGRVNPEWLRFPNPPFTTTMNA